MYVKWWESQLVWESLNEHAVRISHSVLRGDTLFFLKIFLYLGRRAIRTFSWIRTSPGWREGVSEGLAGKEG